MTIAPMSTPRSQSKIRLYSANTVQVVLQAHYSNSTTVLQAYGKLVVLLANNELGCFTRSQPNLLFCWLTMNQVVLQDHNQTYYFID